MRISDWSSDGCSSDLLARIERQQGLLSRDVIVIDLRLPDRLVVRTDPAGARSAKRKSRGKARDAPRRAEQPSRRRSEERRVGKAWVGTCRSCGSPTI